MAKAHQHSEETPTKGRRHHWNVTTRWKSNGIYTPWESVQGCATRCLDDPHVCLQYGRGSLPKVKHIKRKTRNIFHFHVFSVTTWVGPTDNWGPIHLRTSPTHPLSHLSWLWGVGGKPPKTSWNSFLQTKKRISSGGNSHRRVFCDDGGGSNTNTSYAYAYACAKSTSGNGEIS